MTDADIGQSVRILVADGNITGALDHVIVKAVIPLQLQGRIEIAVGNERVLEESVARGDDRPNGGRQRAGYARGISAMDAGQRCRQLATEYRRRKGIGWRDEHQIGLAAQGQIEIDVHGRGKSSNLNSRTAAAPPEAFTFV
ncbi:hypothetical protein FJN17_34455 [Bradyrhizobium symbiodeficiens]|uniref:DUF2171 domain-containing protein n=1 Tax=Bradyrhizobium symbiodeficiens TaxID=1404367 RepID=A0ABZ2F2C2_9BRAD